MNFLIILFVFNIIVVYYFDQISNRINLYDVPDNIRKIHKNKTSCIGGFFIFFNLLIFFLFKIFNEISYFAFEFFSFFNFLLFFLLICAFFIIGFVDDKFSINPFIKLILFLILVIFLIFFDKSIVIEKLVFSFSPQIIYLGTWSIPFSILCVLLFINAFNMFDGLNLQAGIYSFFIFSIFYLKGFSPEMVLIILLSILFFLFLNFKTKCFFGDNGTLLVSFIISYFFLKISNTSYFFYADDIFLIMMVPGIDMFRLFILRLRKLRNPFSPDKNHIHHILLEQYGYPKCICILFSITLLPFICNLFLKNSLIIIFLDLILYFYFIFFKKNKLKNF